VLVRRRRSRPRVARDRALRRAERPVVRVGPAAGVRAACGAVLGCEPDAVTGADAERLPAHPGVVRTVRATLEAEEAPGHARASPNDARLAIRTLRREVRRTDRGAS